MISRFLNLNGRMVRGVFSSWVASTTHLIEHALSPPAMFPSESVQTLTNTRIPGPDGVELFAHVSRPRSNTGSPLNEELPVLVMIHEFFGLNQSLLDRAQGVADELGCMVISPDTFRGVTTGFIPKAIWLALSTPQDRVNDDLDAILEHVMKAENVDNKGSLKLAVMGFCYGGGKAIRFVLDRRPASATVIFYGSPVTDVAQLQRGKGPIFGAYGKDDIQFSSSLLDQFQQALDDAKIENNINVYDGVGHAFWTDMDQIARGDQPQTQAYEDFLSFLRRYFG